MGWMIENVIFKNSYVLILVSININEKKKQFKNDATQSHIY